MADFDEFKQRADLTIANLFSRVREGGSLSKRAANEVAELVEDTSFQSSKGKATQAESTNFILALEHAIVERQADDPSYPADLTAPENLALLQELAEQFNNEATPNQPSNNRPGR